MFIKASTSIKDIAWLAGFLEGEGNFTTNKVGPGSSPIIRAAQKQKEPLSRCSNITGCGSVTSRPNGKWGNYWNWAIHGVDAIQWMMTLYSLMSPERKEKIREIIKMWRKAPGRGRKTKW